MTAQEQQRAPYAAAAPDGAAQCACGDVFGPFIRDRATGRLQCEECADRNAAEYAHTASGNPAGDR